MIESYSNHFNVLVVGSSRIQSQSTPSCTFPTVIYDFQDRQLILHHKEQKKGDTNT